MLTKRCIEYRNVRLTDNLKTIGRLLYQTDSFIYPEFFGGATNAEEIMEEAVKNNLYCFGTENVFGAFENEKLLGMICMNPNGACKWNYDTWKKMFTDRNMLNQRIFDYVADGYFEPLNEEKLEGKIYVLAVCVLEEERGYGIGTEMMQRFIELHKNEHIVLDTLADNLPAVLLYEKCGFKPMEYYFGFSTIQERPRCIRMERKSRIER